MAANEWQLAANRWLAAANRENYWYKGVANTKNVMTKPIVGIPALEEIPRIIVHIGLKLIDLVIDLG